MDPNLLDYTTLQYVPLITSLANLFLHIQWRVVNIGYFLQIKYAVYMIGKSNGNDDKNGNILLLRIEDDIIEKCTCSYQFS